MKKSEMTPLAKFAAKTTGALFLTIALAGGLAQCSFPAQQLSSPVPFSEPATTSAPVDDSMTITTAELIAIVDGDTIETSAGTVRFIGIDTPDSGQCGYEEATALLNSKVTAGDTITLQFPEGQNEKDDYDRLLRYVLDEQNIDLGRSQLQAGNAVARYDSTDGYPAHPKETNYRAIQKATLTPDGQVLTATCAKAAEEQAAAEQAAAEQAAAVPEPVEQPWYMQYSSCAALKRGTAGHPTGPFNRDDPSQLDIYNWFQYGTGHRGDGDGDGLACE